MGQPEAACVDAGALRRIAREYDAVAEIVDDAVRNQLNGLTFGGAAAGRMHVARGEALRREVDSVVHQLRDWSRAAAEIAAALRDSADRYLEADASAAGRIG
jgi:hypothetical protein